MKDQDDRHKWSILSLIYFLFLNLRIVNHGQFYNKCNFFHDHERIIQLRNECVVLTGLSHHKIR